MTLPLWLTSARETVDAAITAKSAKDKREVATDAQEELDKRLMKLLALETAVKVGRAAGWFESVPDYAGAGSAVEALASKGPRRAELNRLQTSLPTFVDQAERAVKDAWTERVRDQIGRSDDLAALADVLARIQGRQEQRDMLLAALAPVQKLLLTLPTSKSEEELRSVGTAVNVVFDKAFPNAEVREFLLAASRTGATLHQLTPAVEAWIRENAANDLVRIIIGAAS